MLILSRKADEAIVIGKEVTITILSVKGKQVRLGISAPPNVSVHREEVYERMESDDRGGLSERTEGADPHVDADREVEVELELPGDDIGNR